MSNRSTPTLDPTQGKRPAHERAAATTPRALVVASALPMLVVGALSSRTMDQEHAAEAGLDRAYGIVQQLDPVVQRVSDLETVQRASSRR